MSPENVIKWKATSSICNSDKQQRYDQAGFFVTHTRPSIDWLYQRLSQGLIQKLILLLW